MGARRWLLTTVCALVIAGSAAAETIVYTDEARFLSQVLPGSYTETFTSLADGSYRSPLDFSGNGFAYTVRSLGDFLVMDEPPIKWLSGGILAGDVIRIEFTSGNVTAIGGDFFTLDSGRNLAIPSFVQIDLSDGTRITVNDPTPDTFRGFISSTPIASILLTPDPKFFATISRLTVGAAVPEPPSLVLFSIAGLAGVGYSRTTRFRFTVRPGSRGGGM
ncbi:MAG: hypothetical protein U0790_25045 [Isosphaeraceae bacterium]